MDVPRVLLPRPFPFMPPQVAPVRTPAPKHLPPDEKIQRRREYNREKQRLVRERAELALAALQDTIEALEAEVGRRRQQDKARRRRGDHMENTETLLPWREIAAAMAEETRVSNASNRALQANVERMRRVAISMYTWVFGHVIRAAPAESMSCTAHLTRTSLGADPASRRLSYAWLTDRLYHNVDRLLDGHGLHYRPVVVDEGDAIGDVIVEFDDDDLMMLSTRTRRHVPATFHHVCRAYDALAMPGAKGDFILAGRTRLLEDVAGGSEIVYSRAVWTRNERPWIDNKVWRTYRSVTRVVVVSQTIHDDATFPVTALQRHRIGILVVDRLDATRTLVRELNLNSHAFDAANGAFVSLDQEGLQYHAGFSDTDDSETKRTKLRRRITMGGDKERVGRLVRLDAALHATS
ncbi:Aste57867_24782 [Aphanomyces stellatus]|uniref:Aste57867_24782 protein n=1 Tax=Aphanomyces stellatus TaxID=120398 RepID=A0A485LVL5_9STRA|nr:hypothetical protein As57867_024704 [Aphanomyces stellatus]VFU01417.1 Aste57867_24782 [Aphanomyces stellatus]